MECDNDRKKTKQNFRKGASWLVSLDTWRTNGVNDDANGKHPGIEESRPKAD